MARQPPLSAGPACLAGAAQEEHLLLLRRATAAGLLLEHMYVLVCICIHLTPTCLSGLRICADSTTLSYLAVSGWLAGGMRGKSDLRGYFCHPRSQLLGWRPGWKDCRRGWLLLDLLAIPRMLCSVAVLCC